MKIKSMLLSMGVAFGLVSAPIFAKGKKDEVDPKASSVLSYLQSTIDADSFDNPSKRTLAKFSMVLDDAKKLARKEKISLYLGLSSTAAILGGGIAAVAGFAACDERRGHSLSSGEASAVGIGSIAVLAGLAGGVASAFFVPADQELQNLVARFNQLKPIRSLVFGSSIDKIRNLRSATALNVNRAAYRY